MTFTTEQNEQKSMDDLDSYEMSIYQDAYLNVPVRLIAQTRGYRGDAGRQEFHRKFQYVLDLAHIQHQRDLRAAQLDLAVVKQNPTMLIWLGKQAGQTDIVPTVLGDEAPELGDPSIVTIVYPKRPGEAE